VNIKERRPSEEYDDVQGRGITSQVDEGDNWVKEKNIIITFYGSYTSMFLHIIS
jgi:hypothetical protein